MLLVVRVRPADDESQVEQKVGSYIIDVIRGDELIEIQFSSLASINRKVLSLLKDHKDPFQTLALSSWSG